MSKRVYFYLIEIDKKFKQMYEVPFVLPFFQVESTKILSTNKNFLDWARKDQATNSTKFLFFQDIFVEGYNKK